MKAYMTTIFFLIFSLVSSCSTVRQEMNTSPSIPAASGEVTAKTTKDGNTSLALKVKHFAPPHKIRQNATNYVAWVRPAEGTQAIAQNVGVLKIDNDSEGSLETITPLKVFNFFITAEYSAQTATPSGDELMWTNFSNGSIR
jgi:hypothetical protein